MKFDEMTLRRVAATGRTYVLSDESRAGLAIRVNPLGSATFVFRFREAGGIKRMVSLGKDFDTAVAQYETLLERMQGLRTRPEEVDEDALFFPEKDLQTLAQDYLEVLAGGHLSAHSLETYRVFLAVLLDHCQKKHRDVYYGRCKTHQASIAIKALLLERINSTPILCARMRSCYSCMFKWAMERDYVRDNPIHALPAGIEKARYPHLDEDEVRVYLAVLDLGEFDQDMKDILKLCFLTMARVGELISLRPDAIVRRHLGQGRLWVPRTKNGGEFIIPLSEPAQVILERYMQRSEKRTIFNVSRRSARHASKRLSKRAAVTVVTPDDLRRTSTTFCGQLLVPQQIIRALLNHSQPGVTTKYYNLYQYERERRDALVKLAQHYTGLGLTT